MMRRVRGHVPKSLHGPVRRGYQTVGRWTAGLRALPDFVVIGGQRCGTTSLFKHLAEHPQVLRPGIEKGVDYYSLHSTQSLDWYRAHFPLRGPARMRTLRWGPPSVFEACTYYMFHPQAIERMAVDLPQAKLVAMLRDPVERAFSAYKHEFARGFETEADFERALDLEDERLAGEVERMAADPDYESHAHRHHAYRRRGQYVEQLRRVLEHYPAEQLLVCDSESFFAAPEREYARILDFLELKSFTPQRFDQHNARPSSPMPGGSRERLANHYRPYDEELADLLGRRPGWVTTG